MDLLCLSFLVSFIFLASIPIFACTYRQYIPIIESVNVNGCSRGIRTNCEHSIDGTQSCVTGWSHVVVYNNSIIAHAV